MKARINRNFLEQTSFDSGVPYGLGAVVHNFKEPGEYEVAFAQDEQVVERVQLVVAEEPAAAAQRGTTPSEEPGEGPLPEQLSIQLSEARRSIMASPVGEMKRPYRLRAAGYVSFTTQRREDAAAIVVRRAGRGGEAKAFDSRRLRTDDIFAVTLARPGTYALKNVLTGSAGKITVAYPTVGKKPYRPPAAITVHCTESGFKPDYVELKPAQGIIFRFNAPSRVTIDLVKPDDGPRGERRRRLSGWRK